MGGAAELMFATVVLKPNWRQHKRTENGKKNPCQINDKDSYSFG